MSKGSMLVVPVDTLDDLGWYRLAMLSVGEGVDVGCQAG
jgi:hypothetical protein